MTSALIITGGRVHSSPERTAFKDLRVAGTRIVDDETRQDSTFPIDAIGASVVPLMVNTVFEDAEPPVLDSFVLTPGRPATFAVIRGTVSRTQITKALVVQPRDLVAVVIEGVPIVFDGAPTRPAGTDELNSDDPRIGPWADTRRDMTQYLTPDGRYTETRNGRPNAYIGRFWLNGDRITYLDGTGFWAFGQYHRGVLHHAGYVLHPGAHI